MTQERKKSWPAILIGIYNALLLLLFLVGAMTQVASEGYGFLPLFGLTSPWSWIIVWFCSKVDFLDSNFLEAGLGGTFVAIFLACNVLSGSANSCIFYFLLKHRQKKMADDQAWEQARRNR